MSFRRVPAPTIWLVLFLFSPALVEAQPRQEKLDSLARTLDCQSSEPVPTAKVLEPCYDSPPVARHRPALREGEPVHTWHSTLVAFPFRMLYPPEGLPAADRVRPIPPCPRVSQDSR